MELSKKSPNINHFDIMFGVAITPEYTVPMKHENEWIELSEGVFLQKAD